MIGRPARLKSLFLIALDHNFKYFATTGFFTEKNIDFDIFSLKMKKIWLSRCSTEMHWVIYNLRIFKKSIIVYLKTAKDLKSLKFDFKAASRPDDSNTNIIFT